MAGPRFGFTLRRPGLVATCRDAGGVKEVADAIGGIRATSEGIDKLPTWPWPPQVLRGFLSAVLLPVIVFFVTRYVGVQIQ